MIRRPPRSTPLYSSAASDVYKRQIYQCARLCPLPQFASARTATDPNPSQAVQLSCATATRSRRSTRYGYIGVFGPRVTVYTGTACCHCTTDVRSWATKYSCVTIVGPPSTVYCPAVRPTCATATRSRRSTRYGYIGVLGPRVPTYTSTACHRCTTAIRSGTTVYSCVSTVTFCTTFVINSAPVSHAYPKSFSR